MDRSRGSLFLFAFVMSAFLLSPTQVGAQVYLGAFTGPAFPQDAEVTATGQFNGAVFNEAADKGGVISQLEIPFSDFELDSRLLVGGKAGYWLSDFNLPFLGIEAEVYGGSPNISDQKVTMGIVQTLNGTPSADTAVFTIPDVDLNMVTVGLNLLVRLPVWRVQPYGGAGLGLVYAQVDEVKRPEMITVTASDGTIRVLTGSEFFSEFNLTGDDVENLFVRDSDFVPALQLIGGVKGFLTENVALFAEYKYVTAEFEFRDFEMDYEASNVFGGIEYHFGPGFKKKE